jgi:AcrR family transcriptional regulator
VTARAATTNGEPRPRQRRAESDSTTRGRVIEAAVACILDLGYYRASSNEIARRASMTWGTIQYHFGTREALMLAVFEAHGAQFVELVQGAQIDGETVDERIAQLLDLLVGYYGGPEYLAYMQILLNMHHDPSTSADVRRTIKAVSDQSNEHVRRLMHEALGPAISHRDLAATVFHVLRGFALSQQLLDTMAYDTVPHENERTRRERELLVEILAPFIERERQAVTPAGKSRRAKK